MNILYLISSSGFFGAENVLLNIARFCSQKGHDVSLICLKSIKKRDPEIHSMACKQGINSFILPCRFRIDPGVILRIRDFLRTKNIRVIHTHGYKSNLYGLMATKMSGIPIVSTIHGWTGETKIVRMYEILDRWIIGRMDQVVAVSPPLMETIRGFGISDGRLAFIPNGIDTKKFDPEGVFSDLRSKYGLSEGSIVLGCVGRLNAEKGHTLLLRAFKKLQQKIPHVFLVIIGDGPLRKNLLDYVKVNDLHHRVIFAGFQKDMPSFYKMMDIFVLPSLTEGVPIALLEAMAMELPVVATSVGGMPYMIKSGETGFLIPPQDKEALLEHLLHLIKNTDIGKDLGKRARKCVLERFSSEAMGLSYLELYAKVI